MRFENNNKINQQALLYQQFFRTLFLPSKTMNFLLLHPAKAHMENKRNTKACIALLVCWTVKSTEQCVTWKKCLENSPSLDVFFRCLDLHFFTLLPIGGFPKMTYPTTFKLVDN